MTVRGADGEIRFFAKGAAAVQKLGPFQTLKITGIQAGRSEDSAEAVQEKNRAALQSRREELEATIEQSKIELEAAATQAKDATQCWWSETTSSIRADFAEWQAELKEMNAEQAAEDAEYDAVVAVSLAAYCLDAAEWAVVRAELARGEADQLMGQGF